MISNEFATLHFVCADRRATAGQRPSLSHAAFRQKKWPPQGSPTKNSTPAFDRAARPSHTNPYEEKPYRGPALKESPSSVPGVFDFQSLLKALSDKQAESESDRDAFMEHCAKRWQTEKALINLSVVASLRVEEQMQMADI